MVVSQYVQEGDKFKEIKIQQTSILSQKNFKNCDLCQA